LIPGAICSDTPEMPAVATAFPLPLPPATPQAVLAAAACKFSPPILKLFS